MAIHTVLTTYKWRIDNFIQEISIVENGGSITSDIFRLNGNSNAEFSMKVERNEDQSCDVYLVCNDFGRKQEIQLDMNVWCELTDGRVGPKYDSKWTCNKASDTGLLTPGFSPYAMKRLAINNIWIFCCEIKHEEVISEFDESDSEDEKEDFIAHREFNHKILAFHSDGHFDSTVIIQARNKEFKASKFALMACSDVFHRMFLCTNSTEANTGIVKIEDIKPEVVDALIHWIYQAKVNNMEEVAMDLYRAADKYDIGFLKEKCIKILARSLSTENLAPRLILAYKFNEEKFKKHIFGFFREDNKNLKHLMASDEWMEFRNEDPEEAKKIVAEIPD